MTIAPADKAANICDAISQGIAKEGRRLTLRETARALDHLTIAISQRAIEMPLVPRLDEESWRGLIHVFRGIK